MDHRRIMQPLLPILLVGAIAATLQGCALVVIGGAAATAAIIATDARTTGTMVDDQSIELKARHALAKDKVLENESHISVISYNRVLLLVGQTPSEELRKRAGKLVEATPNLRTLHNEITVGAPTPLSVRSADSVITSKVRSDLLVTKGINSNRIKVVSENGTVYLLGLVTRKEADLATEIARKVKGVKRVVKVFEYLPD